mmetsp:Transcript_19449/g.45654  ORF Transcript_19449/g.45654 Transcript_19449/m.45654 type:complete len:319 (-) Transcript_19449:1219-2175(-)
MDERRRQRRFLQSQLRCKLPLEVGLIRAGAAEDVAALHFILQASVEVTVAQVVAVEIKLLVVVRVAVRHMYVATPPIQVHALVVELCLQVLPTEVPHLLQLCGTPNRFHGAATVCSAQAPPVSDCQLHTVLEQVVERELHSIRVRAASHEGRVVVGLHIQAIVLPFAFEMTAVPVPSLIWVPVAIVVKPHCVLPRVQAPIDVLGLDRFPIKVEALVRRVGASGPVCQSVAADLQALAITTDRPPDLHRRFKVKLLVISTVAIVCIDCPARRHIHAFSIGLHLQPFTVPSPFLAIEGVVACPHLQCIANGLQASTAVVL